METVFWNQHTIHAGWVLAQSKIENNRNVTPAWGANLSRCSEDPMTSGLPWHQASLTSLSVPIAPLDPLSHTDPSLRIPEFSVICHQELHFSAKASQYWHATKTNFPGNTWTISLTNSTNFITLRHIYWFSKKNYWSLNAYMPLPEGFLYFGRYSIIIFTHV